jgi:hypothetical protein
MSLPLGRTDLDDMNHICRGTAPTGSGGSRLERAPWVTYGNGSDVVEGVSPGTFRRGPVRILRLGRVSTLG